MLSHLTMFRPSVEVVAGHGEVAILLHQTLHMLPILGQRLLCPPGLQVSLSVVFPPVVIKGVTELVSDREADPSEVENVWPGTFIEGVLEDAQGK